MPTTIKLKNSVTTTNAPSSLVQGEVAINITDKKVWVGNAATTPIQLLGDGGSGSFTSIAFGAGTVSNPSITFTGDTNTGIYSPAADTIAFTEGGVESMRIDSSGNVGIGTSSPNASGVSTAVTLNGSSTAAYEFRIAGAYQAALIATSSLLTNTFPFGGAWRVLQNGGAEAMRIDSSGNVGIGTSSPATSFYKLTVAGDIGSGAGIQIRSDSGTSNVFGRIAFTRDGTDATTALIRNSNADYSLQFWTANGTSNAERMRIDSSGNVGIGTSSPAGRLDVRTNSNANALTILQNDSTGASSQSTLRITAGGRYVDFVANYNGQYFANQGTNLTTYYQDYDTQIFRNNAGAERMRITSGGNLLVGTNSLLNSYDVSGSIHSLTTDAKQLNLRNSNATAGRVWTLGMTSASEFIVYANGTTGQYMTWNATSWTASSDERLKTDLKPIENAVEKVKTLRTVTGRFKTDEENVSRAFLIAQDVQKVLPEAVDVKEDEDKTLGLRYTETIPLLLAAIKEQQAMIEELTNRIKKLEGV